MSDPSSIGGLVGTDGNTSGFGDEGPVNGARDKLSHAGMRQLEGEEGPSWSVRGDKGKSRRPIDKRTSSSFRVILGMAIYNSRVCGRSNPGDPAQHGTYPNPKIGQRFGQIGGLGLVQKQAGVFSLFLLTQSRKKRKKPNLTFSEAHLLQQLRKDR